MMFLLILSLAVGDPQPAPNAKPIKQAMTAPDKVICREFPVTGSLASTYKSCKTRREWDAEREAIRTRGNGFDACANGGILGKC